MDKFKASRKIGIKLLDGEQLKNSFPQCDNLLKNIQLQRERAAFQNGGKQKSKLIEHEYYLMHDNIFGIFGGRGSGKTSVLFSLREIFLEKEKTYGDIVLPIIMPEIINSECTLLGWVLAMFGDVVGEIEYEMKKNIHVFNNQEFMRKAGVDFFENCRFNERNQLREEYDLIYRECFSNTSNIAGQYSYVDTLSIKADQSRKQYHLLKSLNKFWNLLVNTKYQIKHFKSKNPKECLELSRPLIFIIFDDIDLAPERSMELLTSAFKCFSNPNVVIIISAAMKTLEHVLVCKMYEKVIGSHFSSLLQGAAPDHEVAELYQIDKAKDAAMEYLNKVIPPASRFSLERYDTYEQKLLFRYSREWEWEEDHSDTVRETSKPIMDFLIDLVNEFEGSSLHNFLLKDKSQSATVENFITSYLMIFGNKNRYIFNGCLEIMNALEKLKDIKEKVEKKDDLNSNRDIYFVLNHLLSVLITSNDRNVVEYQDYISHLLLLRKGEWDLYINYALLLELYEKKRLTQKKKITKKYKSPPSYMDSKSWEYLINEEMRDSLTDVKQSIGVMFVMLFFIENLLRIIFPKRGDIHGYWEITEYLNKDITRLGSNKAGSSRQVQLYQSKKLVEDIISDYALVLENPRPYLFLDLFNFSDIQTYFTNVYYDRKQREELEPDRLSESCKTDYYWSKTIMSLLFTSQSGLLLVKDEYYLKYNPLLELLVWWEFGENLKGSVEQVFEELLNQNHILDYSEKQVDLFKEILLENSSPTPKEWVGANVGQGRSLETFFRDVDRSEFRDILLQNQCRKLWEEFKSKHKPQKNEEEYHTQEFNRTIISFTEFVITLGRAAFINNDFIIIVEESYWADVEEWINNLMDISPIVEEKGKKLIKQFFDGEDENFPEQRVMQFRDFFLFMTEIRNTLKNIGPEIDESDFPFLPEFIEYCPVYESSANLGEAKGGQMFSMFELVLNLHLLKELTSFYFAAQFIIANSRQYHSLQIRTQSEQSDQQDSFAAIYQKIATYVETSDNFGNILTQTFMQAKEEVIHDYRRQAGAGM
ncbi:MAG: hypothetical protein P4L49_15055 [Desulfosporosinus sp.]|nr:hypothetical protein [Desulfosporosinus sp.]